MNRKVCEKKGHKWVESMNGFRFPVQSCQRWGCGAERPDPLMLPEMQEAFRRAMES